jgi:hypothetical protein
MSFPLGVRGMCREGMTGCRKGPVPPLFHGGAPSLEKLQSAPVQSGDQAQMFATSDLLTPNSAASARTVLPCL